MWFTFKDTMIPSIILKTSNKSVWSKVFDVVKYVYSESVFNKLYIEINHNH